jgi:Uma2 family endonuclease
MSRDSQEQQMSTLMTEPEIEVSAEPQRRRFTVEEFQRMGEAGILAPEERVELIDGEVIQMTPVGARHNWSVIDLTEHLIRLTGDELQLAVQCSLQVGSEQLSPDFAMLRRGGRRDRVPQPEDCVLLVEVAESSVSFDTRFKARKYASVDIPEYWVLDLPKDRVLVYRRPEGGSYRETMAHARGASFTSPALGGRTIQVADLLGAR